LRMDVWLKSGTKRASSRVSIVLAAPELVILSLALLRLAFDALSAPEAHSSGFIVAKLGDGHEVVAALHAEAAAAVATVLGLAARECPSKLVLALRAVVGQVRWDPRRGLLRAERYRRLN